MHLDHELRSADQGKETLDAVLGRVFKRRRAPSLWSAVPEVRPGFRRDFRTRYVQGRETIPLAQSYALVPARKGPDPEAGPVVRRLTLLLTGDTQGYLENCGCKANQSGGVARRATALARLRARDPGALLLDAGSAFVRPEKQLALDFLTRQEQALYLGTFDMMRYQAAAIGTTELAFGLDYFREQTRGLRVPYLAANITRDGRPIAPGSIILMSRGLRVGLIGIFEPPYGKAAPAPFEENTLSLAFADPIETLQRETAALRTRADLVMAFGRLTPYSARRAAAAVPGLDAILSSENRAPARTDPMSDHVHSEDAPGFFGRTLVAYSSLTNYGLVSVRLGLDARGRIASAEFEDHWLYEDTPDDPAVREALNRFYDRVGKEAAARDAVPPLFADDPARLRGAYVGAAACAECHAPEMAQWRRTKHASAYKTLLDRHRHFQPRCVACHVVGYGTPRGHRLGAPDETLANVQCEVCHGPGGEHSREPRTENIRRLVPPRVCLECHTPDHSDHFVYEERLPRVKHDYYD
jgi:mono/diheme cytochrome c family protein